jgi:hypothetical protein
MDGKVIIDSLGRKKFLDGFVKYTKFKRISNQGSNWRGEVMSYFPYGGWLTSASVYQVLLWGFHIDWIPIWVIIAILAIKFYIMMLLHYIIGKYGIKLGLLRAEAQVSTKVKDLNPVNQEFLLTMRSICEKTGAINYFTELNEKEKS